MLRNQTLRLHLKRTGLIIVGVLTLTMIALSFVEAWVTSTTDNIQAYGAVPADSQGLPNPDEHAAFLMLNDKHSAQFPGNVLELLAVTDPGVVDTSEGAHLKPSELKSVYVQTEVAGDPSEYHVYRIGVEPLDQMKVTRDTGGRSVTIVPQNGHWEPGAYLVDVPAEGMFGGRNYYQFYVDAEH